MKLNSFSLLNCLLVKKQTTTDREQLTNQEIFLDCYVFSICSRCFRSENNLNFAKREIVRSIRLSSRLFSNKENGIMVLDSWLDSVYPDDSWKWIHHFPCVQ